MQRLISFDIAKAICIIFVVIGHYLPSGSPMWYMMVNKVIYSFHMPLFMFASGYIYMATKKPMPYQGFLLKKMKRLMLPYFSVSLIVITIKLLTEGNAYVENPVSGMSYVKMFYLPEAGYFLWFIWALWWMFVLVPLFKTKQSRLALCAVALIAHALPICLPEIFCLRQFQMMLVFFMAGVVCCDWKDHLIWVTKIRSGYFFLIFAICEIVMLCNTAVPIAPFLPYIGIAATMALARDIEKWCHDGNEWLMIVASSSYIIYLFHTAFEGFAKAIIYAIPIFADTSNMLLFIVNAIFGVTCGVVCPILLQRYVLNKTKVTRLLFGLK